MEKAGSRSHQPTRTDRELPRLAPLPLPSGAGTPGIPQLRVGPSPWVQRRQRGLRQAHRMKEGLLIPSPVSLTIVLQDLSLPDELNLQGWGEALPAACQGSTDGELGSSRLLLAKQSKANASQMLGCKRCQRSTRRAQGRRAGGQRREQNKLCQHCDAHQTPACLTPSPTAPVKRCLFFFFLILWN